MSDPGKISRTLNSLSSLSLALYLVELTKIFYQVYELYSMDFSTKLLYLNLERKTMSEKEDR